GARDAELVGPYNAVGPEPPITMGDLLETCVRVGGSDARLVWVDDAFLLAHDVEEWMELPLWLASPEWAGLHDADIRRAVEAGLTYRTLDVTVRDTLEWARAAEVHAPPIGPPRPRAGMDPEREASLLREWQVGGRTS